MKTKIASTIFVVAAAALFTACSSSSGSDTTDTSTSDDLRKKDPCAACSSDCLTCTDSPGCGWDAEHGRCRSGDVYGPSTAPNLKNQSDWKIGPDFCKDTFAPVDEDAACEATTCMTCAATTNCGWQEKDGVGKCLPGGSGGPWNVVTTGAEYWYWDTSDCALSSTTNELPAKRCQGNGPAGGGYPSGGSSGSGASDTSDDYVCDVSVEFPDDNSMRTINGTFPDYGCAPESAEESTTYADQCDHLLADGATSCAVANCHPTGIPYVCPCSGPSDPRSYCH